MGRVKPKSRVLEARRIGCPSPLRPGRPSPALELKDPVASQHCEATLSLKPTVLGSSLNVFNLVLTSVECCSSLCSFSSCILFQVHSNGGGFDEVNFCALRVGS